MTAVKSFKTWSKCDMLPALSSGKSINVTSHLQRDMTHINLYARLLTGSNRGSGLVLVLIRENGLVKCLLYNWNTGELDLTEQKTTSTIKFYLLKNVKCTWICHDFKSCYELCASNLSKRAMMVIYCSPEYHWIISVCKCQ